MKLIKHRIAVRLMANEKPPADFSLGFVVANEMVAEEEGWVLLSPYGRFPNVQGLQVFNASDAASIANEFHGLLGTPQRLLGLPFYIGHPDHPLYKDRYKDTRAYGRIKALEARQDPTCSVCNEFISGNGHAPCVAHGLFGRVKWNEDGKKLIANESYAGHSVNWRLKKVGSEWHPFSLKSVGFTNEPNIPVPAITTANETIMPEWANDGELLEAHFKKLAGVRLMANGAVSGYTRIDGKTGGVVVVPSYTRKDARWPNADQARAHLRTLRKGGFKGKVALVKDDRAGNYYLQKLEGELTPRVAPRPVTPYDAEIRRMEKYKTVDMHGSLTDTIYSDEKAKREFLGDNPDGDWESAAADMAHHYLLMYRQRSMWQRMAGMRK